LKRRLAGAVHGALRLVQPGNARFAFFSLFAARFSIRLFAGFFLPSFLVSFALLMAASSQNTGTTLYGTRQHAS
jgi:hypothetical protein